MNKITRRIFVSQAAASLAAVGALAESSPATAPQLVWKSAQWKVAEFQKLAHHPARVKQVFNCTQISGGMFLNNIKNSLNGLHFGFDIPADQIKIAAALHGPANLLNYDDSIWSKYRIGEWLNVTDPATGKPAEHNIFYPSRHSLDNAAFAADPDDRASVYQDTAIQTLDARGVQFLSCHTATEEQARALVERNKLPQAPEEVVEDLLAHTLPGVLVVTSMVAAIALLQSEGRFSYINA